MEAGPFDFGRPLPGGRGGALRAVPAAAGAALATARAGTGGRTRNSAGARGRDEASLDHGRGVGCGAGARGRGAPNGCLHKERAKRAPWPGGARGGG
jgi:hypothetical protein